MDFTEQIKYMKGTPLPIKLADKLKEDAIFDPNPQITNALASSYISNTSAKKTAHQSIHDMMDYNYKEENFLEVDAAVNKIDPRELRTRTKGQFDQTKVNSPNQNFTRDIKWLHKANPEAVAQEKKFFERDHFFLAKKHHSKVLQDIVTKEDMRRTDQQARKKFLMAPLK